MNMKDCRHKNTYITDANIWIDLYVGEILEKAFAMPSTFIAPDVIIDELKEPCGQYLLALGLIKEILPGEGIEIVSYLAKCYPAPSRVDLFSLALAKTKNGLLLTGDKHLRKAAEKEKIRVHGTLWLLDRLVEKQVITSLQASSALKLMLQNSRRLPRSETMKRIKKWNQGGHISD